MAHAKLRILPVWSKALQKAVALSRRANPASPSVDVFDESKGLAHPMNYCQHIPKRDDKTEQTEAVIAALEILYQRLMADGQGAMTKGIYFQEFEPMDGSDGKLFGQFVARPPLPNPFSYWHDYCVRHFSKKAA